MFDRFKGGWAGGMFAGKGMCMRLFGKNPEGAWACLFSKKTSGGNSEQWTVNSVKRRAAGKSA
jgi:hypothetical protein